jgi:hypothetical protein
LPSINSPDLSPVGRPATEAAPMATGSHLKDSSARVGV